MASPDDLSALCLRCGLCCDGTLFDRVTVATDEVARVAARGLPLHPRASDGALGLRQPCAALAGTRCTIYAERPASCARYECLLLRALAEGEVDLAEALTIAGEARALVAANDPRAAELLDRRFRGRAGGR